jgi:echinoid
MVYCFPLFSLVPVALLCSVTKADEFLDSREGENVVLKCRFNEQQSFKEFSYYWARWTNAAKFENVAISGIQLNTGYR